MQTADALDLAADQHPDIVIIDPRLPENDGGIAFIQRLREHAAGRPDHRDEPDATPRWTPALAACFDGFVRKTFRPNDLQSAILGTDGAATDRANRSRDELLC